MKMLLTKMMGKLLQVIDRLFANSLSRAVWRHQFRILLLALLQLLHQLIIGMITDFGRCLNVVLAVVNTDCFTQLFNAIDSITVHVQINP